MSIIKGTKRTFHDPFKYAVHENVFPEELYKEMLSSFPKDYYLYNGKYPNRYANDMDSGVWRVVKKQLEKQYKNSVVRLFRDLPGYQIGPHTDSREDKYTILFYLTDTEDGTGIYEPKIEGFTSTGGKHLKFDQFNLVKKIPFKKNTALSFERTDNSFHGVEKTKSVRDLIILIQK